MYSVTLSPLNVESISQRIKDSKSILLSTHKQCDGDGLGAILSLYHALKKMGKTVRCMTVDDVPKKYFFLDPMRYLEVFERPHKPLEKTDLALIFDTNDHRLVEPLYSEMSEKCKQILFIDHHPVLNLGPEPTLGSYIETRAASTGEIAYFIIKSLNIRMDQKIAECLYTSVAFDTQLFKFVKNSVNSHLIAAEVLQYLPQAQEIHRHLFATHTVEKVAFLAKVLSEITYFGTKQIAVLRLSSKDLDDHGLDMDDSRDVIDMLMNIQSLQAAALFRQEGPDQFKLSLRSKGSIEVLGVAEDFGGGGHLYAAGAFIEGPFDVIKKQVVDLLLSRLDNINHVPKPSQK